MNLLRCETCDIELHGRDVYFDGKATFCRHCNNPVGGGRIRRAPGKPIVPLPPSIQVEPRTNADGSEMLRLVVPWRLQRPQDGMRLMWWIVVAAVTLTLLQLGVPKLISFAIGAVMLVVIVSLRKVNSTTIRVLPDVIEVSHGPLPWPGHRLEPKTIQQLYVHQRPIAQGVFDYSVRALLDDGRDIVFFRALKQAPVALYLEQCIEGKLRITDRRVKGEYVEPPFDPNQQSPYLDPQPNSQGPAAR